MRESVGYSVTINIVITFVVIAFGFLMAVLIYFKSNKVGNIITESIENHSGFNAASKDEISKRLTSIGYNKRRLACPESYGGCSIVKLDGYTGSEDGYCVYLCYELNNPKGKTGESAKPCREYYYYKIRTNMFINIPIINDIVQFPIYSETNRMFNFEEYDKAKCEG